MQTKEDDFKEFELTGFYKDQEHAGYYQACENAIPPKVIPSNSKKYKARIVEETDKAYKFKTKRAYFWIAKKLVHNLDRLGGTVHVWGGAEIKWLKK